MYFLHFIYIFLLLLHILGRFCHVSMYKPWVSLVTQMVKNLPVMQEIQFLCLSWEDPLEKERLPTPVFLPGEFHGQRSLVGYSPWGGKELDMTEWLTHTHTHARTHAHGCTHVQTIFILFRLNGREFEQAPRDGKGQGCPVYYSPRGPKESDTTKWLDNSFWVAWNTVYGGTLVIMEYHLWIYLDWYW